MKYKWWINKDLKKRKKKGLDQRNDAEVLSLSLKN